MAIADARKEIPWTFARPGISGEILNIGVPRFDSPNSVKASGILNNWSLAMAKDNGLIGLYGRHDDPDEMAYFYFKIIRQIPGNRYLVQGIEERNYKHLFVRDEKTLLGAGCQLYLTEASMPL
jgi:hypothetical protein